MFLLTVRTATAESVTPDAAANPTGNPPNHDTQQSSKGNTLDTEWVITIVGILLVIILLALMYVPNPEREHDQPRPKYRVLAQPGNLPTRAHTDDAGLDLRATANVLLSPGQRHLVGTGVEGAIPTGHLGLMCSRSGLAHKHGIAVLNAPGIIDANYRGELKANLINLGDTAHVIRKGDRIAQLLIITDPALPVVQAKELDPTSRGTKGHGSTGTN